IQADWAKVVVQAKIVTYEWGEYLKRAKDGEHQTVMMGWTGDNGDPDNFFATLFSCAASEQGSNYSKWCYKPFEDLIQPARATDDHNKRVELYKQRSEEHTSELQSRFDLVCRLLLEKK